MCEKREKSFFSFFFFFGGGGGFVTTKSTFDLSLRKSTPNRLDYLYEISHVPEDNKIPITDFPIVNPYTVFDYIYIYIYLWQRWAKMDNPVLTNTIVQCQLEQLFTRKSQFP